MSTGERTNPTGNASLPEPLRQFSVPNAEDLAFIHPLEALLAEFGARRDSGSVLPNVMEALRIELTYHSNAIEGSTLTLRDTQLVIEGHTPAGVHPMREIYEARNHDRALRSIENWVNERGNVITQRDLLDVQAMILADIDSVAAGRFRAQRVLIAGSRFVPPGPQKFQELLTATFALANRVDQHPVLRAAELHHNLVAVHPFSDGNGRTARLMMSYLLLRHGYPAAIIEVERRAEYLAALSAADAGVTESFGTFVVDSLARTLHRVLGTG